RFGLLEMSRQRLRPSLGESSQQVCPRCHGEGRIRSIESLSLSVLRLIEEEAMKERTARVVAQLPVEAATFLLNEKRDGILRIEQRCRVDVILVPNPNIETPDYEILRQREDEIGSNGTHTASYALAESEDSSAVPAYLSGETQKLAEEPAVKALAPARPAPPPAVRAVAPQPGLLTRLWRFLFGTGSDESKDAKRRQPARGTRGRDKARDDSRRRPQRRGGRREDARGEETRNKESRENASRNRRPRDEQKPDARKRRDETALKPAAQATAQEKPAPRDGKTEETEKETGRSRNTRRGRRGGRRRRKNSDGTA